MAISMSLTLNKIGGKRGPTAAIYRDQTQRILPRGILGTEQQSQPVFHEGSFAGCLCVFGGFLALFSTFGWLNALGLFQTYYENTLLRSYSESDISWIFTMQLCVMFAGSALFGRVIDTYGTHYVAIPCAIISTLCVALLSLCTEYYQIFLAQGLGFGLGAAGLYSCSIVAVGQWFHKWKAFALGVVAAGSSLGGVIHPIYLQILIDRHGFPIALRWSAVIIGITSAMSCMLIRSRLPRRRWDSDAKFFDWALFKQPIFSIYCLGSFLVIWGLFAPWNYLPTMSLHHEFSETLSTYTIVVLNAVSTVGRLLPSLLADHWGRFNIVSAASLLSGILILAFWLPIELSNSTPHAQIFAFAALYGFSSGAFISIMMPCVAELGEVHDMGSRFGVYLAIVGLASLNGLPIQGALIPQDNGGFGHLIIFSGVCTFVGAGFIYWARTLKADHEDI